MGELQNSQHIVFDQYQRYHFIQRAIDILSQGASRRVLEVGGAFSSPLPDLLPHHRVLITDSILAPNVHLRSSGLRLPFPNDSFEVVVTTDTLEHVPPENREAFLTEAQRVSSDVLIVGFPHDSFLATRADKLLSEFIQDATGNDYHFLAEHREYGLPDPVQAINILRSKAAEILEFKNANIHSWLSLMMSYFALENQPEFCEPRKVMSELFNYYYEHLSHEPPTYRTFLVCFKKSPASTVSAKLQQLMKDNGPSDVHGYAEASLALSLSFQKALSAYKKTAQANLDRVEQELSAYKKNAQANLDWAEQELEVQKQSIFVMQEHLKNLDTEIRDLIAQRQHLMGQLDQATQKLNERETLLTQKDRSIAQHLQKISEQEAKIAQRGRDLQEKEDQLVNLSAQNENLRQYLDLFLNHPGYKIYKYLKDTGRKLRFFFHAKEDRPETHPGADPQGRQPLLEAGRETLTSARLPQDEQTLLGLAKVRLAHGDYNGAEQLAQESLSHNPQSYATLHQLGSILLAVGSFWRARLIFTEMRNLFPESIEPLMNLGDIATSDGRYGEAAEYYRAILELDAKNLTAISGLVDCSKQDPEARTLLDRIRQETAPDDIVRAILVPAAGQDKEHEKPLVSIVIPVYNQVEFTRNCLDAIRNHTTQPYELIVIDNASEDETPALLSSQQGVKLIRNESNRGFVQACNQGAALATGKYLVFLNNDTLPQRGWLDALTRTAENDPNIGAVGAKLLYPDGKLQEAGSIYFRDGSAWNYGKGEDPAAPAYNYVRETTYCSAACLLTRRTVFEQIGGFDLRYAPAYCEDADLAFAIRKLGMKVVYQPEAQIIHFEGVTAGTDTHSGFKRFQPINQEKFKEKWAKELEAQPEFDQRSIDYASHQNAKKRILVIDHYLPAFDRSAGNHRAFQLLKLMREAGHHVTFVARNGECQGRYKNLLEQLGVETYATDPDRLQPGSYRPSAPKIDFSRLLRNGNYSAIVLSRYEVARTYLPLVKEYAPQTPVLLDTVDVHFIREQRQADLSTKEELRQLADQTRLEELSVCRQADAIITVTEEDAGGLRKELGSDRKIWVIPTIHRVPQRIPPFANRKDLLFVGNFVHPPNPDAVFYFCAEILPAIRARLPEVRFYVVGANSKPLLSTLGNDRILITGYVPDLSPFLDACRVSVAPLRYGAGMKGKIGEAMAHGLPVVTSSIGAEGLQITHGQNGWIADDPKAFADAVVRLYTDEMLWNEVSRNAQELVRKSFSPQAVKPTLNALLDNLLITSKLR